MRKEVVVQWIFGNLLVNKRNEFRWVFSQPHWPKLIRDPGRMVRFKGVIYIYICKSEMFIGFFREFNLF